jgi:hypothetical protein
MAEYHVLVEGRPGLLDPADQHDFVPGHAIQVAHGAILTCTSNVTRRGIVDATAMVTFGLSVAGGVATKLIGDWLSQKFLSKGLKITVTSAGASREELEELKKILDSFKQ